MKKGNEVKDVKASNDNKMSKWTIAGLVSTGITILIHIILGTSTPKKKF